MRDLPPLPAALTRMRTVVGTGTVLWLVAAAVVRVVGAVLGHTRRVPGRVGRHAAGYARAESPFHWSQESVQSQMSPSRAESLTGVPVTSTGSP